MSCVEKTGFQQLIGILAPGLKVRGRTFYTNMLKDRYAEKKCALTKALQSATDVGTTADCWTSRRKSYLGQTVHWFDNNLQRKSGCLGISRVIGSHTYDVLAKAMESMHVQYQIVDKLGVTTTDNGANFLKAFREFGREPEAENSDEDEIGKNLDDEEDDVDEQMVYISLGDILEHSDNSSNPQQETTSKDQQENVTIPLGTTLPPHRRCSCHLLNLVCKADVLKIKDARFQKLRGSVESKLQSLWNKQSSSSKNSDIILKELGKLFIVRNDTRWNSLWNAFYRVLYFIKEKPDGLRKVMDELKVPQLQAVESQYISEYVKVMRPMVEALDILQGEENVGMGFLLPTLSVLYDKLEYFKKDDTIKQCQSLVNGLLYYTAERYAEIFLNILVYCH